MPKSPLDRVVETCSFLAIEWDSMASPFWGVPKLDSGDPLPVTPRLVERFAPIGALFLLVLVSLV